VLHDVPHHCCVFCVSPAEAAEHDLVIKQLEPMDKTRKCHRLIGDVLVERTVGETLPAGEQCSRWERGGARAGQGLELTPAGCS
jgi:hypothetical protein